MAVLHYQQVSADAVGTLAGTVEAIGNITLPSNCSKLYGIIVQDGSTGVKTTAEGVVGQFICQFNELAKTSSMMLTSGSGFGGAPAATAASVDPGFFVPIQTSSGVNPANVTMSFTYDIVLDSTDEQFAQVFALSSNGPINEAVLANRGRGLDALKTASTWWDTADGPAIGVALATATATNITVPSYVKLITAMAIQVQTDAVLTAGEHWGGYVTLAGTIPDLYPMNCPIPLRDASLGAVTSEIENNMTYVYPMHIPHLANTNDTITCTVNLNQVTTAGSVVSITLFGV